jgi:ribosomal protein S18 acetylase RimI-like enzyme
MTTETTTVQLPAMTGLVFRHFEGDADFEGMAQVSAALSDADHLEFYPTAGWLKNFLSSMPNSDLRRDMLIAVDAGTGELVSYGRVGRSEQLDGIRRFTATVQSLPAWRDAEPAMWRWFEAHASAINATLPPNANTVIETWAVDTQTYRVNFLTAAGYAPVRWGYEMTRPLNDAAPIPDFPLPEGFKIRPATPAHYRAVWDADIEAFRDHNGFSEPDEARYEAWLNDPMFFQPALWKVAWHVETNEIAGMVQNYINHDENARLNRKRGYTENISTRRQYRKRGLARALIAESLRMHQALGMTEAALGVDATNPTGALRVYEDCGFKPVKTETVYRKLLQ